MKVHTRAALAAVLLAGSAQVALAQIPGMPLFTNPRYGTGFRVHGDVGQPTESNAALDRVIQAGMSFALGPIGFGANVGMLKSGIEEAQICVDNPSLGCEATSVTASALAQLRVAGGGSSNLSLSLFGGASMDVSAAEALDCASLATVPEQQQCQLIQDQYTTGAKQLNIPLGVAIGLRIPLGVASLNLWGAPRMQMIRFVNCDANNQALCDTSESSFRWAVGADLPIFRVISLRAAYDSGKIGNQTVTFIGVGASIGIGGMR